MFLQYLRLGSSLLALGLGGYTLLASGAHAWAGWGLIFIAFLFWVPWRGLFLTYVYFHYKKKSGLNKNLSLLSDFLPALMSYSHHRPPHYDHPTRTENSLRLMVLNAFEPNREISPKAEFLADEDADIVAVSEVNEQWELALKTLKHSYPYQKVTQATDSLKKYNMLLLSKFPTKVIRTRASGRIVHYIVSAPRGDIYLVQVHPIAPFTLKRTQKRNRTLEALANIQTELPLIIMGDFNCVPWQKNIRKIMTSHSLKLAGLPEPTYPSQQKLNNTHAVDIRPFAPLDYILVPRSATLLNQKTFKVPETDHLALSACIELNQEN